MLKEISLFGAIAGAVVGAELFLLATMMHGHTPEPWGEVLGYSTMLVALSTVFIAIKRRRDTQGGGIIKFLPAFGLGLGISFIASVLYALAWEAALAVTHMDFGANYAQIMIAQEKAKGVTGAALAKVIADANAFKTQYANPLYRIPMSFTEIFPVGVLVSLISAALLRNPRFLQRNIRI